MEEKEIIERWALVPIECNQTYFNGGCNCARNWKPTRHYFQYFGNSDYGPMYRIIHQSLSGVFPESRLWETETKALAFIEYSMLKSNCLCKKADEDTFGCNGK